MISIAHLTNNDKIELMRHLWNIAKPTYYHIKIGLETKLDEQFLKLSIFNYTENLCGKIIKLDLSKKLVDPSLYNKIYGDKIFESILNKYFSEQNAILETKWKIGDKLCVCQYYFGTRYEYILNKKNILKNIKICNMCNSPYDNEALLLDLI